MPAEPSPRKQHRYDYSNSATLGVVATEESDPDLMVGPGGDRLGKKLLVKKLKLQ